MIENSKKEIIEKLERLEQLLKEALELEEYVDKGAKAEYIPKVRNVMKTIEDLEGTPTVFKKFPSFPIDGRELVSLEADYLSKKKIVTLIAIATSILLIIFWLTFWGFFNTLSVVGIFALIIFGVKFSQSKKKYFEKKKAYEESMEKHKTSMVTFQNALRVYEEEKVKGVAIAQKFNDEYKKAYETYDSLLEEYAIQRNKAMGEFCEKLDEAKTIDFVPEEYYHLIRPIIVMLKSGRADSYKEALNLAIQEEKEEQVEAARRAEDARRTQIMEEQAAEESRRSEEIARHNREMEREQQQHNRAMIEEQRKQERDAAKQRQQAQREAMIANDKLRMEANKQANQSKQAGISKCASCANSRNCPSHVKNSGAGLTCGGYRPYK